MAEELLPCPFCGSTKVRVSQVPEYNDLWHVWCWDCGASGGNAVDRPAEMDEGEVEVLAVKNWNRRARG